MCDTPKKSCEKLSAIVIWALLSFIVFTAINIGAMLFFNWKVNNIEQQYATQHTEFVEAIKKNNPELKEIVATPSTHEKFLEEFHSTQSNWLNAWIMLLAMSFGIMGVIIPIFMADKGKEIKETVKEAENIIDKLKKVKLQEIGEKLVQVEQAFETLNSDLDGKIQNSEQNMQKTISGIKSDMTQIKTWYEETENAKKITVANSYFSTGNKYLAEGQNQEAIDVFQKAIDNYPEGKFSDAYNNQGIAHSILGNYSKAITAYKEALKIKPNSEKTYFNMGNTYIKQENYSDAIKSYKEALKIKPDMAEAYSNLGSTYLAQENYPEAIEAYKKAMGIEPKNAKTFFNLGLAYIKLENYPKSIECYQKAIELNPDFDEAKTSLAKVYNNFGNDCLKKEKRKQAIDCYQKAIELSPDFAGSYYNLTEAYIFNKQPDEALLALETFKQKEPNPWMVATDREPWENALKECPQGEAVEKIRKIIAELPDKK